MRAVSAFCLPVDAQAVVGLPFVLADIDATSLNEVTAGFARRYGRDMVRSVVMDVTINKVGTHPMTQANAAGFDASFDIKRSEFGVGGYAPAVSDEVRIEITVEAQQAK